MEFEKYSSVHSDCVRWEALQFDLRLQFLLMHSIVYSVIVEKRVTCYQFAVMLLLERGQIIIRVLRRLVAVEDSSHFCDMDISDLVFILSIILTD